VGPLPGHITTLIMVHSTALAHDIHEQILVHQRSLFLVGHAPGSGIVLDDEVQSAFLAPLSDASVLRREETAMSSFTPIFATCTDEDIAHLERERDKDSKRKKRATRARRGVILLDREPQKTHRTLINPVGPNGITPTPAEPAPAPVQSHRRAAAIAAQANINLLAQDLPIPQPPTPPPLAPSNRGRKPGRGGRGTSRTSPTPGREESIVNGDTPVTGVKRSFREDSVSETTSPVPPKKRNNGRITSPDMDEGDTPVRFDFKLKSEGADEIRSGKSIKSEYPLSSGGGWHCLNCGVPESLSGGIHKDAAGGRTLCGTCGEYIFTFLLLADGVISPLSRSD